MSDRGALQESNRLADIENKERSTYGSGYRNLSLLLRCAFHAYKLNNASASTPTMPPTIPPMAPGDRPLLVLDAFSLFAEITVPAVVDAEAVEAFVMTDEELSVVLEETREEDDVEEGIVEDVVESVVEDVAEDVADDDCAAADAVDAAEDAADDTAEDLDAADADDVADVAGELTEVDALTVFDPDAADERTDVALGFVGVVLDILMLCSE